MFAVGLGDSFSGEVDAFELYDPTMLAFSLPTGGAFSGGVTGGTFGVGPEGGGTRTVGVGIAGLTATGGGTRSFLLLELPAVGVVGVEAGADFGESTVLPSLQLSQIFCC